jgi:hypothetical protein
LDDGDGIRRYGGNDFLLPTVGRQIGSIPEDLFIFLCFLFLFLVEGVSLYSTPGIYVLSNIGTVDLLRGVIRDTVAAQSQSIQGIQHACVVVRTIVGIVDARLLLLL